MPARTRSRSHRHRRPTRRSPTSAQPFATRSASRSPATRWRRSSRAAAARPSWSSRPPCPFPARPATRGRPRSSPPPTSSSESASPATGRRSSSPQGSPAARAGGRSRASSRRSSRCGSAATSSSTTPRTRTSSISARAGDVPLRVARALAETDAVVTVGAAQTVLHGGPASLLAASGADAARAASADSLLEAHSAPGWALAVALERTLARRVPLIGASLTLDLPRLSGALRGFPYEPSAVDRIARSRLARAFRLVPSALRMRMLASMSVEQTASAAFGGPPSVAHAEALVRGIESEQRRPRRAARHPLHRHPANDARPPPGTPERARRSGDRASATHSGSGGTPSPCVRAGP